MTTPGVTVRPIPTMAGPHEFNEVFFDDVVVPRDGLLGAQDGGWEVVTAGLTFERVGIARYARAGRVLELAGRARRREPALAAIPHVRRQLADLASRYEAARLLNYRAISCRHAVRSRRVEASIARMHNTSVEQLVGHVGLELLGPRRSSTHDGRAPLAGVIRRQWVRNIPTTIAAGTLEVQKNIIAQRGLGLPRPS